MMKTIRLSNVCEARRPCASLKSEFQSFYLHSILSIKLTYFPLNPANYPYKMEYCICNGGVGTVRERNLCI